MPKLEPMLRYAITDRVRLADASAQQAEPARQAALLAQAERLAAEGIDFLQLREKDLSATALASLARNLLATLRAHNPATRLLINSRADIAVATCADGVHLTSSPNEFTPAQVRALYAAAGLPEPIISLSCHTLAEVTRAASSAPENRPTLILFGPVFEKVVGNILVTAGAGLDLLRAACAAAAPIPVLALGGITRANTDICLDAGAAGVAAIRLFLH
ncbi:MAG: thiamine phosphate synthase [Acidobacteriaceae bacterium]